MDTLWIALGLLLVLEGMPWFLSPAKIRALLRQLEEIDDGALRGLGFAAMAAGLALVWLGSR